MSNNKTVTSIKQAIDSFLLSYKVEGKSYGTIEGYTDKLKGFLWYTRNYDWPDDVTAITTNHLREFLTYAGSARNRRGATGNGIVFGWFSRSAAQFVKM